jgi:membrane protein implicated in regulation of membrane protease activity
MAVTTLLVSVVFAFLSSPMFGSLYFAVITVGVPIFLWHAFKWWPNTLVGRRILLNPEEDPALQPNVELQHLKALTGKHGIAKSKMMFSGQIEVEGRRLNALSESTVVEIGDEVVVVSVDGINVIVRPVPKKTSIPDLPPKETEPTVEDPFA